MAFTIKDFLKSHSHALNKQDTNTNEINKYTSY